MLIEPIHPAIERMEYVTVQKIKPAKLILWQRFGLF